MGHYQLKIILVVRNQYIAKLSPIAAIGLAGIVITLSTTRQACRPDKYFLAKIELGHQIQSCFSQ